MRKLYFLPYNMGSGSIKELQGVLGGLRIKEKGKYGFNPSKHLVVNWGNSHVPYWHNPVSCGVTSPAILNHYARIGVAVNKLLAFQKFKEANVPTPEFTTDASVARSWTNQEGVVFCRTMLSASEGRGIVVANKPEAVVAAPLYTRLFPKDKEYRVHVFKGAVIDFVQKKLKKGELENPNRSKYIRNTENGWVFCREGVSISEEAKQISINAVKALGLDFGAVDIAVNKKGQVVVFEVNTAPGLEGTTVQKYAEAIKTYQESLN